MNFLPVTQLSVLPRLYHSRFYRVTAGVENPLQSLFFRASVGVLAASQHLSKAQKMDLRFHCDEGGSTQLIRRVRCMEFAVYRYSLYRSLPANLSNVWLLQLLAVGEIHLGDALRWSDTR